VLNVQNPDPTPCTNPQTLRSTEQTNAKNLIPTACVATAKIPPNKQEEQKQQLYASTTSAPSPIAAANRPPTTLFTAAPALGAEVADLVDVWAAVESVDEPLLEPELDEVPVDLADDVDEVPVEVAVAEVVAKVFVLVIPVVPCLPLPPVIWNIGE